MKIRFLVYLLSCMTFFSSVHAQNYTFSGTMTREQLELYLSRAITMQGLMDANVCYFPPCSVNPAQYDPAGYTADIQMLATLNARFIGRSTGLWGSEWVINSGHFNHVGDMVQDIHTAYQAAGLVNPIVQAAIFEFVSSDVNGIQISPQVASVYGEPIRKFDYTKMTYSDYPSNSSHQTIWYNPSTIVPDMSKKETQMWFYYMATQYIDRGIEALHLGQVEIMDDSDPNHTAWWDLLSKIRAYASTRNRHLVLLDAHTFGLYAGTTDNLLFDFHASPIRMQEMLPAWPAPAANGGPAKLDYNPGCGTPYGRTKGGHTYFGWYATKLPYLVEFDNFGISSSPNSYGNCWFPWGWDEISWFGLQKQNYRDRWLEYAYYKVKCLDEACFLEMPGKRGMTEAGVAWPGHVYRAANGSGNQQNTIQNLWNGGLNGTGNWVHHNFTSEQVYNQPALPHVNSSLIFVGSDKAFYIGNDRRIHGYIKDNGATGVWRTVSPSYSAQIFNGQPVANQALAQSDLVASPDGSMLLYIGQDGYVHGFNIVNVWNYTYFNFVVGPMFQQKLKARSHLLFASPTRAYYIAQEKSGALRVHGFIRDNGNWVTVSPTYASQVPASGQVMAAGALTYDKPSNRLYYVGTNGFLYYYNIINDWTYSYQAVPQNALLAQNLRIAPGHIACSGNRIFYVGRELSGFNTYRIHALIDNGGSWSTVSPSWSAHIYNGQSVYTQQQADPRAEITVSPDGKLIAYIGKNNKVYYYRDINAGWNFSYNTPVGTPVQAGASNSLQFTNNQELFWTSTSASFWPFSPTFDNRVHEYRLQESYCQNPAIKVVEPAYQYHLKKDDGGGEAGPVASAMQADRNAGQVAAWAEARQRIAGSTVPATASTEVRIYIGPNPASTSTTIRITGDPAVADYTYTLTDLTGRMVVRGQVAVEGEEKIDVSQLPRGVYFVSVLDPAGQRLKVEKITLD